MATPNRAARFLFPASGRHRFRDTLYADKGGYWAPMYEMRHADGRSVVVIPAHIIGQPQYFRDIEEQMQGKDGAMQIMHQEERVMPQTRAYTLSEPEGQEEVSLPNTWDTQTNLFGVDNTNVKVVSEFNAIFWGHLRRNPRAKHQFDRTMEIMQNYGVNNAVAPLAPFHVPSYLKLLEDAGFTLEREGRVEVCNAENEKSQNRLLQKMPLVLKVSRVNFMSNDFLPSILLFIVFFFPSLFGGGRRDQQQQANPYAQQHNPYAQQGYGGYAPPPQGGYPPQYGYPPQGGYPPPQQGGYPPQGGYYPPPQQHQQPYGGYQAAPPPSPFGVPPAPGHGGEPTPTAA